MTQAIHLVHIICNIDLHIPSRKPQTVNRHDLIDTLARTQKVRYIAKKHNNKKK
jgi:hypothetical protein